MSDSSLDAEIDRHVAPCFEGITHVMGFGLTPTLMRMLDRVGIQFVDLEIAQLRFSSKLRFRARTNSAPFGEVLEALRYPINEHIAEAQRMLSAQARRDRPKGLRRGVFLGQTQLDLALVENGRLRRPYDADVIERLQPLVEDLDEVHILPHPISANRMGHLLPLTELVDKTVIGASSTYAMLSHPDTIRAIGLSSSALIEADLLGLEAHSLLRPDRDNPSCLPDGMSGWIEVDDALFSPETMAAFANGSSVGPVKLRGAGLVEAALGANLNTLAASGTIRDIPRLQAGLVHALGSNASMAGAASLQFGWSAPEPWGVWSTGQVASLAFRLATEELCTLHIRGVFFEHQTGQYRFRPELSVQMSSGGKSVPLILETDDAGWRVNVDLPEGIGDEAIMLHFLITGACSPSTFGINPDPRKLGIGLQQIEIAHLKAAAVVTTQTQDAEYYSQAHRNLEGYRVNNWMMPFARPLRMLGVDSVIECACGNGEFSEVFARHVRTYWAMDWAASPLLPHSTPGFRHLRWDAYTDTLPQADLLCSADFLEHIREGELDNVLSRMLTAAPRQFHVVACYDDSHSHLTIEPPEWWLDRLRHVSALNGDTGADWQLLDWSRRNPERPVAVVCNFARELSEQS